MVEARGPSNRSNAGYKSNVIVMGTLGIGKSTLLNKMSGMSQEQFETAYQPEGCTHEPKMLPFDHFNLIDTPGLNDPNMSTNEW